MTNHQRWRSQRVAYKLVYAPLGEGAGVGISCELAVEPLETNGFRLLRVTVRLGRLGVT